MKIIIKLAYLKAYGEKVFVFLYTFHLDKNLIKHSFIHLSFDIIPSTFELIDDFLKINVGMDIYFNRFNYRCYVFNWMILIYTDLDIDNIKKINEQNESSI
jgi:hypothetical protein